MRRIIKVQKPQFSTSIDLKYLFYDRKREIAIERVPTDAETKLMGDRNKFYAWYDISNTPPYQLSMRELADDQVW